MKKRIMVALSALFLAGNVFGQTGLGFQAIENSGKVTITGYIGSERNLIIPETANGMPIVAIGNEAFRNKGLISITIPASVMDIGTYAFADNQLRIVSIGANVKLGNSAIDIGFDEAYNNAGKPAGIFGREYSDGPDGTIWGLKNGDFLYIGSKIIRYTGYGETVTIPSEINGTPITSIGNSAFSEKRLTSITIPNSVTLIGDYAFAYNELISVTIGPNVQMGGGGYSDSQAFPSSFLRAYNGVAGTYTRPSTSSNTWTKGVFSF